MHSGVSGSLLRRLCVFDSSYLALKVEIGEVPGKSIVNASLGSERAAILFHAE